MEFQDYYKHLEHEIKIQRAQQNSKSIPFEAMEFMGTGALVCIDGAKILSKEERSGLAAVG